MCHCTHRCRCRRSSGGWILGLVAVGWLVSAVQSIGPILGWIGRVLFL